MKFLGDGLQLGARDTKRFIYFQATMVPGD